MSDSFRERVLDEVRRRRRMGAPEVVFPKTAGPSGRPIFRPERGFGADIFTGLRPGPPRRRRGEDEAQFKARQAEFEKEREAGVRGTQLDLARRRAAAKAAAEEEKARAAAAELSARAAAAELSAVRSAGQRIVRAAQQGAPRSIYFQEPSHKAIAATVAATTAPAPVTAYGRNVDDAVKQARNAIVHALMQQASGKDVPIPVNAVARLLWETRAIQAAVASKAFTQANFDSAVGDARDQIETLITIALKMRREALGDEIDKVIFQVADDHRSNPRQDPIGAALSQGDDEEEVAANDAKVDERTIAISKSLDAFVDAADNVAALLEPLNSQKLKSRGGTGPDLLKLASELEDYLGRAIEYLVNTYHNREAFDVFLAANPEYSEEALLKSVTQKAVTAVGATYEAWLDENELEGAATVPDPAAKDDYEDALRAFWTPEIVAKLILDAWRDEFGDTLQARLVESVDGARIRRAIRQLFEARPRLGIEPAVRAQDRERLDPGADVPELENTELADQIRRWKVLTDAKKAIEAQAAELKINLETGQVRKGLRGGVGLADVNRQIGDLYEKQIEPALLEMDEKAVRVDGVVFNITRSARTIVRWQAIAKAMQRDVRAALTSEMERMKAEGFAARADALAVALAQVNQAMEAAVGEAMRLLDQADALLPDERVYTTPYATLKAPKTEAVQGIGRWFMMGWRAVMGAVRRLWSAIGGLGQAVDDLETVASETLLALE